VTSALGLISQKVLLVSSNGFDVAAARRFDFIVAWIERAGGLTGLEDSNVGPAEFYKFPRGRAEGLEYRPDFRINAITDLSLTCSRPVQLIEDRVG